jgi:hypothetical protein
MSSIFRDEDDSDSSTAGDSPRDGNPLYVPFKAFELGVLTQSISILRFKHIYCFKFEQVEKHGLTYCMRTV